MGRDSVEIKIVALLSRHNSEQDAEDDAAWAHFQDRLKELTEQPRYSNIGVWIV